MAIYELAHLRIDVLNVVVIQVNIEMEQNHYVVVVHRVHVQMVVLHEDVEMVYHVTVYDLFKDEPYEEENPIV